jgi:hypothetical protein
MSGEINELKRAEAIATAKKLRKQIAAMEERDGILAKTVGLESVERFLMNRFKITEKDLIT